MIHERNLNTESAAERASESHVCRRCYLELFIGDLSLCTSDYSIIVLILFKLFGPGSVTSSSVGTIVWPLPQACSTPNVRMAVR